MYDTIGPLMRTHLCGLFYNRTSDYCCSQRKRDSKPQQQELVRPLEGGAGDQRHAHSSGAAPSIRLPQSYWCYLALQHSR